MNSPRPRWVTHPVTAAILGMLAAGVVIWIAEMVGHALFGIGDPRVPGGVTTAQYLVVLIAWILGTAVGALVATRLSRSPSPVPGVFVGVFILLGAVGNFMAFPHPMWMQAASLLLPPLGFAVAQRGAAPHTVITP